MNGSPIIVERRRAAAPRNRPQVVFLIFTFTRAARTGRDLQSDLVQIDAVNLKRTVYGRRLKRYFSSRIRVWEAIVPKLKLLSDLGSELSDRPLLQKAVAEL